MRRGTAGDLSCAAALNALVSANPWQANSLKRYFDAQAASYRALVVAEGNVLQGFLIYSLVVDEGSVDNIAVHPDHQGKGLGRSLLEEALEQMREAGAVRCLLEVAESNLAARTLYDNNGFVIDGRRAGYYKTAQGREDALLMSRRL